MPSFFYILPQVPLAASLLIFIEVVALGGLLLARRHLLPRLRLGEGTNEAVSGTVQSIGVFYGITVGLIAVSVWNRHDAATAVASREAAAIGGLYRDVSMLPEPARGILREQIALYTDTLISVIWPAQRKGETAKLGTRVMDDLQEKLSSFQPANPREEIIFAEALSAYNTLVETRRLRMDAADEGLSGMMWGVIWVGAAISIGVAYLFKIDDPNLHIAMVGLMAAFLSLVVFMILINDRPFFGYSGIEPDSYRFVQQTLFANSR